MCVCVCVVCLLFFKNRKDFLSLSFPLSLFFLFFQLGSFDKEKLKGTLQAILPGKGWVPFELFQLVMINQVRREEREREEKGSEEEEKERRKWRN